MFQSWGERELSDMKNLDLKVMALRENLDVRNLPRLE